LGIKPLSTNKNPSFTENENDGLFVFTEDAPLPQLRHEEADIQLTTNYYSGNFDVSLFGESAGSFFELSADAFDIFIHAWMSELPIEKELIAFGRKVITAAETVGTSEEKRSTIRREAASKAAVDRSDSNTLITLNAAEKVRFEIHRMMGFLRFSPDENGIYTARCAPDHFVIPSFGEYLTARFGETAWTVIDEKRSVKLSRRPPEQAKILLLKNCTADNNQQNDEWEGLWKHYHRTISNETRKNAGLQRQLMPKRYWKYLPEIE
jgi:probable DNA metabolism protein